MKNRITIKILALCLISFQSFAGPVFSRPSQALNQNLSSRLATNFQEVFEIKQVTQIDSPLEAQEGNPDKVYLKHAPLRTSLFTAVLTAVYQGKPYFAKMVTHRAEDESEAIRKKENRFLLSEVAFYKTFFFKNKNWHPKLSHILRLDEGPGLHVLLFEDLNETVPGKPLSEVIEEQPLSIEDGLRLTLDIAKRIKELEQEGFTHNDIKPSNIWIPNNKNHSNILFDFGLSFQGTVDYWQRLLDNPAENEEGMGTWPYMSPRKETGEILTMADEIYSLMYTFLNATSKSKGSDIELVRKLQYNASALQDSDYPEELHPIIRKGLILDERRLGYQDIDSLINDLENILGISAPRIEKEDFIRFFEEHPHWKGAISFLEHQRQQRNIYSYAITGSFSRAGFRLDKSDLDIAILPASGFRTFRIVKRLSDFATHLKGTIDFTNIIGYGAAYHFDPKEVRLRFDMVRELALTKNTIENGDFKGERLIYLSKEATDPEYMWKMYQAIQELGPLSEKELSSMLGPNSQKILKSA